jgi:hypothetical protein
MKSEGGLPIDIVFVCLGNVLVVVSSIAPIPSKKQKKTPQVLSNQRR